MSALKMTADRIADVGECRFMMSMSLSHGSVLANNAGTIAKYFATSFVTEKVVSAPCVISNCLPISTTSMSLVGSLSRSTMLPASLAAWVPGVHGDGHVGLRQGGSIVGAVAHHRDELSLLLLLANVRKFLFGRAFGDRNRRRRPAWRWSRRSAGCRR